MFRSIFVPAKWFLIASGTIFVPDLASLGSPDPQRNQKPQKEFDLKKWDQNRTQNCGQNRDQNWTPKLGPELGPKKYPELKDLFWPDFWSFFGTNFGSSFGTKFRRIQTGISCFDSTLKSGKTRVSVKEMTKPAKPDWKIMQGQHQPSFELLLGYQITCEKLFFKHPGCVSVVLADLNRLKEHQPSKDIT